MDIYHHVELEKLKQEEAAMSNNEGWNFAKQDDTVEVWYRHKSDQPIYLVRVSAT